MAASGDGRSGFASLNRRLSLRSMVPTRHTYAINHCKVHRSDTSDLDGTTQILTINVVPSTFQAMKVHQNLVACSG